jgi:hypothetical protein
MKWSTGKFKAHLTSFPYRERTDRCGNKTAKMLEECSLEKKESMGSDRMHSGSDPIQT